MVMVTGGLCGNFNWAQAEIDKEIQEAIAAAEAGGRRGYGLTAVRDRRSEEILRISWLSGCLQIVKC